MKKKIFSILLFITILLLTGCTTKDIIEPTPFKTMMEKKGFTVTDQTNSIITENPEVEISYYVEQRDKRYAIEYYSFSSELTAQTFYAKEQAAFSAVGAQAHSEINVGNYSKYSIVHKGKYGVISRISNTVIYVNANNDYSQEIKELLKEIGY